MMNGNWGKFSYAQDFLTQQGTEYITVEFYKKRDGKEMAKLKRVHDKTHCQHMAADEAFHYVRSPGGQGRFVSPREIWPELYQAFLRGDDQRMGLPLSVVELDQQTVYHYGLYGVTTLEQLKAAPDDLLRQLGPEAMEHRERAAEYLASVEAAETDASTLEKIDELERENARLREQLADGGQVVEKEGLFQGWTVNDLRNYLEDNGVKLHGGWKIPRLTEEAEKVAASLQDAA